MTRKYDQDDKENYQNDKEDYQDDSDNDPDDKGRLYDGDLEVAAFPALGILPEERKHNLATGRYSFRR